MLLVTAGIPCCSANRVAVLEFRTSHSHKLKVTRQQSKQVIGTVDDKTHQSPFCVSTIAKVVNVKSLKTKPHPINCCRLNRTPTPARRVLLRLSDAGWRCCPYFREISFQRSTKQGWQPLITLPLKLHPVRAADASQPQIYVLLCGYSHCNSR